MPEIRDVPTQSRYEITVEGQLAGFAAYADADQVRVFTHTEIDPQFEGQGVGSTLIGGALDDVRTRHLQMLPVCPFVRAYVGRHPDYADLVHQPDSEGTD